MLQLYGQIETINLRQIRKSIWSSASKTFFLSEVKRKIIDASN